MRKLLLILLISIGSPGAFAQESSDNDGGEVKFIDRLYVGGDVGLQFTAGSAFFNFAPFIGCYITPRISAGVGLHYQWTSYRSLSTIGTDTTIHDHIFGGSAFARYDITDQFILHVEYEVLNTKVYDPFDFREYRRNVPIFMVGGGWKYRLGPKSYAQFLILYDVIDDRDSPYPQYFPIPILFRGGFVFQLGKGMELD